MTEQYASPWKNIAAGWAKLGVGNHPSAHNVSVYEQYMLEHMCGVEKPSVLLLGATPELRDMFATHPMLSVTVLDFNAEMTKAMTELMTRQPIQETWVTGDWVRAPLPPHSFDVILGDHVSANVVFDEWEEFYAHMNELLKPGGAFVSRIITRFSETSIYDPHEFIKKFTTIPPTKESLTEFWNVLCFHTHHEFVSPTDRMYAILESHLDWPYIREYYDILLGIIPRGKVWSIGRSWEEEKRIIEKYFTIEHEAMDDTFFSDSTKIYSLKPIYYGNRQLATH